MTAKEAKAATKSPAIQIEDVFYSIGVQAKNGKYKRTYETSEIKHLFAELKALGYSLNVTGHYTEISWENA